jgi:hypothetical protein
MPLFINKDRLLVDDIISKARDRLAAAGHSVAFIALNQGIKNQRCHFMTNDLPLHRLVDEWPGQGHGPSFRHHGGPEVILAFLEDNRLDPVTRFELRKNQIKSCFMTGRSLQAMEMVENLATLEPDLSEDQHRSIKANLAIYLAAEGRYDEFLDFVSDWPDDVADEARAAIFRVMPEASGEEGRNVLNAISSDEVRATALQARIQQEQRGANNNKALVALRKLRSRTGSVLSLVRRVK